MHPILARNEWLLREVYAPRRTNCDLLDPSTRQVLLQSRSSWAPGTFPGPFPFIAEVRTVSGDAVVRLKRGWAFLRSDVTVFDELDSPIGRVLHQGAIVLNSCEIFAAGGPLLYTVKRGHLALPMVEYRFKSGATTVVRIIKHWTGLLNQCLLNVKQYKIEISPDVAPDDPRRTLILSAAICMGMVGGTTAVDVTIEN